MTANMSDMKKAMMETQSGEKVTSKTNILLQNTFSLICFSWNLPFQFLFTSESVGEGHPGEYPFSALQGISPLFNSKFNLVSTDLKCWIEDFMAFLISLQSLQFIFLYTCLFSLMSTGLSFSIETYFILWIWSWFAPAPTPLVEVEATLPGSQGHCSSHDQQATFDF